MKNVEKKRRFATKIIARQDDKVLCIIYQDNRLNGFLDFPGGKIEPGESQLDTCMRELREETELAASGLRYVGTIVNECSRQIFDIQVYVSSSIAGIPHNTEGNQAVWLTIEEVRNYPKRLPVTHLVDQDKIWLLGDERQFILNYVSDEQSNILQQELIIELEP